MIKRDLNDIKRTHQLLLCERTGRFFERNILWDLKSSSLLYCYVL